MEVFALNNFREWLSDNLRYILLLAGILAVLLALFFGVRTLTGGGKIKESQGEETAETVQTAQTEQTAETKEEAKPTETPKADHGTLTENADPQVSKLISDYYAALEARNVAAIKTMTDTLPEEDAVAIEGSTTKYSDIHVYTKDGPAPGSLVVFAAYKYLNENQPAALPGLAQMLVKKAADGSWKISYAEKDEATAAYMESVKEDEDVKALIAEVTKEYQEASKAMGEDTAAGAAASKAKDAEAAGEESGKKKDDSAKASEGGEETGEEAGEEAAAEDGEATDEDQAELESLEVYDEENANEASEENAEESEEQESEEEASDTRSAEILSSCNVRSGPGYDYKVLGEVRTGTPVTVIGELDGGWWHIQSDSLEGYVGKKFIPEA